MPLSKPSVIADRSAGVILGGAAGDALGAPFEFGPPLDQTFQLRMTGGGSLGWEAGEWTDDTQMALALLSALAAGRRDLAIVERGLLEWFASGPRDVGNQTRAVLSRGAPLSNAAAAADPDGAGNGGLMRIGPAALSFPGDPGRIAEYAAGTTALTHPHPDCLDASVLWAVAIDQTIHHAPEDTAPWDVAAVLQASLSHLPERRRRRWRTLIDEACRRPAVSFDNNGWVVHAFQGAVASIVATADAAPSPAEHARRAIETSVRCGGDTDTVAAITGCLVGARCGASALPPEWIAPLHGRRIYGRPVLMAADLAALVNDALRSAAAAPSTDDSAQPERSPSTAG